MTDQEIHSFVGASGARDARDVLLRLRHGCLDAAGADTGTRRRRMTQAPACFILNAFKYERATPAPNDAA